MLITSVVVSISAQTQPAISDYRPLKLGEVTADVSKVPRYGKIEFSFSLQGFYENAFDPDQIDVTARVRGPDSKTIEIPGFYYQSYKRALIDNSESLTPQGAPGWRVRFSPMLLGQYSITITARDQMGAKVESKPTTFECVASDDPGFIRRSLSDSRYFAFDNGRPYVPIGANVCWAGRRGTFDYDDWLRRYGEAGCNYFRLWLGPSWTTFAFERRAAVGGSGLGKFDLANAWRLDYVLDLARRNGLHAMLCLDSHVELREDDQWKHTPHNISNGGPLKEPVEFWTNPTMLRLYRNKIRYLVARYAWSAHVMSWEFWNEVDAISPAAYQTDKIMRWHEQMSDYLRKLDPWKHLQTTSLGKPAGEPSLDGLDQMDFTQTHHYDAPDIARALADDQKRREMYKKPHYVGESGLSAVGNAGVSASGLDPDGIALHSSLWSAICSGSAGGPMFWYWDNYIHPKNLYTHFSSISKFIKGVDFPRENFRRICDAEFTIAGKDSVPGYRDVVLTGPVSWKPSTANKPTTVIVSKEDSVKVQGEVSGILHGVKNHLPLHNPLTFQFLLPHPSKLRVYVSRVSEFGGAHLIAELDGKLVLDKDMPYANPQGKFETVRQYNGEYVVDIPEGAHSVKIENTGLDWVLVKYVLDRAERPSARDPELFGLRGKTTSLLWIRNSQRTWHNVYMLKREPDSVPPTTLRIASWPSGTYKVSLWDTYAGEIKDNWTVKVGTQGLVLDLPAIQKDIALKVKRL